MRPAPVLLCALIVCTGPVAGTIPAGPSPQSAHLEADSPSSQTQTQTQPDGTPFERVNSENAGLVIRLNAALLTSFFEPGSTLRLVVGGTANGERVVWFDIGIGYRGGSVLSNPTDGFVVRSEMTMNVPL